MSRPGGGSDNGRVSPTVPQVPQSAGGAVEDLYPLSPLQHGLLFHLLREPGSPHYLSQRAAVLRGVPVARIRRGWHLLAERHPVLRTGFLWEGLAEPVQVVYRWATLPVDEVDLRTADPADRERRVADLIATDRRRGFRPDDVPLARLTLVRLTDDDLQVVWTHHGLVTDGWGSGLLFTDLHRIERALAAGDPLPPPPTTRFRDYVARVRDRDSARDAEYWRGALAGVTAATPLPLADERGTAGPDHCESYELHLTAPDTSRIRDGARHLGVPFGVLAQAAWALVLSRYAGVPEVVFGLVTSGRTLELPGIESIIGLLTNTLPVRVAVPPGQPVGSWLQHLAREHAARLAFEHTPLAEARRHSGVPGGAPLFETVLLVQNLPPLAGAGGGGAGYTVTDAQGFESTHYPITVFLVPGERLTVRVVYRTGVVTGRSAKLLADCVRTALLGLAGGRGQVGSVPVFPPSDRHRRRQVGGPLDPAGPHPTVPELLDAAVAHHPERTAVSDQTGLALSYRELDRCARLLARTLAGRGAGPERCVGVLLERSVGSVIAMAGTWKAGAVYVPVDPAYPAARIEKLLTACDCHLVVTTPDRDHLVPGRIRDRVVYFDRLLSDEDSPSGTRPSGSSIGSLRPDHLAYVIYTSGSTGSPHGVMVSHRALVNTLRWLGEALPLDPGDVVAHKNPLGFTDSLFEVLWPLFAGAAVSVIDGATARDPHLLHAALRAGGVTHSQLVPRHLDALAGISRQEPGDALPRLRWVVNTAEPLPASFAARWDEAHQHARIANIYGMTESAIFATSHLLARGAAARTGAVPIGTPIRGVTGSVRNQAMELCPPGVAGELYLGGVGLARGYLGRPGLTAERLVPDPSGPAGSRSYRTGDRVREYPDGTLEYLGRTDFQLKVRGFRVEPAEVEEALRAHPAVRDAVVTGHEGRLAGYLVPRAREQHPTTDVRQHLADTLPPHQVPTFLQWLDALPMTAHDKVDRRQLPEPVAARDPARDPVRPGTAVERTLARIWVEALGVAELGIHDDFFELGGDSLLAIRVVARVRDAFPVDYTVNDLFRASTVAGAAGAVTELLAAVEADVEAALAGLDAGAGQPYPAEAGGR